MSRSPGSSSNPGTATAWCSGALCERPGDGPVSKNVMVLDLRPVEERGPDLIEAMRLHHLVWEDD